MNPAGRPDNHDKQYTMEHFTCEDIHAVMSGLLDGELDGETRHLAERHLVGCHTCRVQLQAAEDADALVRAAALEYASAWTDELQDRLFKSVTSGRSAITMASAAPAGPASATGSGSATITSESAPVRRLRLAAWSGWSVAAAAALVAGVTLLNGFPARAPENSELAIDRVDASPTDDSRNADTAAPKVTTMSDPTALALDASARNAIRDLVTADLNAIPVRPRSNDFVSTPDRRMTTPFNPPLLASNTPVTARDSATSSSSGGDDPLRLTAAGSPWWTEAIVRAEVTRQQVGNVGQWLADALATGIGGEPAMAASTPPVPYDLGLAGLGPRDLAMAEQLFRETTYDSAPPTARDRDRFARDTTAHTPHAASDEASNRRSDPNGWTGSSELAFTGTTSPTAALAIAEPDGVERWLDDSASPIRPADHVYNASVLLELIAGADADSMDDLQQIYRVLMFDRELLSGLTASREAVAATDTETRRALDQAWTVLESVHASVDQRWLRRTQTFIADTKLPDRLQAISLESQALR